MAGADSQHIHGTLLPMVQSVTWRTRCEETSDVAAIRTVNLAAFATHDEADLVDALRRDPAWIEGLSWVATAQSGDVIAHALLTRCFIQGPAGAATAAACLAPCAVAPEFQRRGAGTAVIESALNAARYRGESIVVVLGHPEFYPRFGFQQAAGFGISVTFDVPQEALMVQALTKKTAIPAGRICYPEPFGIPC